MCACMYWCVCMYGIIVTTHELYTQQWTVQKTFHHQLNNINTLNIFSFFQHSTEKLSSGTSGHHFHFQHHITASLEIYVPPGVIVRGRAFSVGRVLVEVAAVDDRAHIGSDGRHQGAILQAVPVEALEPSAFIF